VGDQENVYKALEELYAAFEKTLDALDNELSQEEDFTTLSDYIFSMYQAVGEGRYRTMLAIDEIHTMYGETDKTWNLL
jgi:hypothetical protein